MGKYLHGVPEEDYDKNPTANIQSKSESKHGIFIYEQSYTIKVCRSV
jgi:hypothetical protein